MQDVLRGLRNLTALLAHPAPGFVCVPAGRVEDGRRHVARVRHLASPPVDSRTSIAFLKAGAERNWHFGVGLVTICEFFARHDGVLLYAPTISRFDLPIDRDGGINVFPLADWLDHGVTRVHELFDTFGVIDPPVGRDDCIAIGQVPHSSNLFALPFRGPRAGQVVRLDHDRRLDASPLMGGTFDLFLATICRNPAWQLANLGCYTRYADGQTDEQWIPATYTPDVRMLSADDIRNAATPDVP